MLFRKNNTNGLLVINIKLGKKKGYTSPLNPVCRISHQNTAELLKIRRVKERKSGMKPSYTLHNRNSDKCSYLSMGRTSHREWQLRVNYKDGAQYRLKTHFVQLDCQLKKNHKKLTYHVISMHGMKCKWGGMGWGICSVLVIVFSLSHSRLAVAAW